MKTLVQLVFGSHLYGTNTPESDTDFKGVFMPTAEQVLLGRIPKSMKSFTGKQNEKNTKDDVDQESYSLHYFIHLASLGETVALDMLHADESHWVTKPDPVWLDLVSKRDKFYTKNLRALVGYARRQAAKYGIKGSRIADAKIILDVLEAHPGVRLYSVSDLFRKDLENVEFGHDINDIAYIDVCGKKFLYTTMTDYAAGALRKFVDNYGNRAKQAEANQGIDWKAISHAYRAAYQVRHILEDGGFKYPLPETNYLKLIKSGAIDYSSEAAPGLDTLIDHLEILSSQSSYPEKVNQAYWDAWLMNVMKIEYAKES